MQLLTYLSRLAHYRSASCAVIFRPLRLELCARSEVAPLDGAPLQAATGQHHVSGADGQGLVLNDGGGLQTTLLAVRRCPLCSSGHLEIQ